MLKKSFEVLRVLISCFENANATIFPSLYVAICCLTKVLRLIQQELLNPSGIWPQVTHIMSCKL